MTIVRNNSKSKSGLFLLELIIAIVFFALSSVICIQLFVKAHTLSQKNTELNMAVIQAQNAAEAFKAANGEPEKFAEFLNGPSGGEANDGQYVCDLFFNSDWQRVDGRDKAAYTLHVVMTPLEALRSIDISVWTNRRTDAGEATLAGGYGGENIYSITAKTYVEMEAKP